MANTLLHHGLSGSVKCTVICEQKVTHCSLLDLGLCLKPMQVEESHISSVPNDNNVSIIVAEGIRQHGCEYHAKQCGGKDAALLDTVSDRECLGRASIVSYLGKHAIVELAHHSNKFIRAAKLTHYLP